MKLLLESGADVNIQGSSPYGPALQAASYAGHQEVVKLLLESGADVNAQGGKFGSALQAASYKGHQGVVKLLLKSGADVNAQGGAFGSALHEALCAGYKEIVELLLERGADVNTQERQGLLPKASYGGDKKMVELLGKRANVNAQETQTASSFKDQAKGVLRLLPDKETDVNAQKGQPDDALQAGPHKSHGKAVLREAEESNPILEETTTVPTPEVTEYDSSTSDEIMSDEDEDSATGDTNLPAYDSPLASLKDRIFNPVEYFDKLGNLTHLIYQHSTLLIYSKKYSPRAVREKERYLEPCPRYPEPQGLAPDNFEPIPDSDVMRICQDIGAIHSAFANDLLEILECRNVTAQTYSNLRRLQLDAFCLQKLSMLVIDPCRQDVVRLLPIDIQQILHLLKEIDSVLRKVIKFVRGDPPLTSSAKVLLGQALEEQDNLLLAVPCCTQFLTNLGLVLVLSSDTGVNRSISAVLRLTVHTADLAVVSYAGAHLSRFDEECLGEEIAAIDVLSTFPSFDKSQIASIKLSRCQLQCLDSFHNSEPVWVFSSSDWESRGNLFLSTKVEEFADIWGPLWKVIDPETHKSCTRYAVGNGYIYKWKPQKATPRLSENETLCHWISNSSIETGLEYSTGTEKPFFPDIADEAFDDNEILLIGAVAAGCERLTTKEDCDLDIERTRSVLNHDGRVQMLGTVKEHTYKDSETYQLQAGHGGITASASKQYKRRGQSLKQALVEAWMTTPGVRDPGILQDFYGLEVSLCTQNAQRIQLGRVLSLGSMCRYLRSFRWETDCAKRAYFDALKGFREDPDALQHTWENYSQYQEDFGRAVLVCLKALEKTGINHKGQLSTFLSSQVTARPELIAIEPKEHSWIGLLKDNESSCCMAIIGDECLEFQHELGTTCGRSRRSCLRTSLVINRLKKPHGIRERRYYSHEVREDGWTSRWSARAMEIGSDIWLGRHGTLRLLSHLPDGTLLMDWRASLIATAMKSFFDKGKPHREFSENIRKEARRTRPIPIFVISN